MSFQTRSKESRKSDSWIYKVSVVRTALRCLKEISELSQHIGHDKVEYIRRKVRKEYKNKNVIIQLSLVLDACRDIKKENEIESVKNILRECPAYTLLYQFSPKDTGQSKVK